MGMQAAERTWSVEEVQALPADGNRYEVVDGELLVTPAPRLVHQSAVGSIFSHLRVYVERERVGYVFLSPADIVLRPDALVQPDVFVVPAVGGGMPRAWSDIDRLLLAVEVLSPGSAHGDRTVKRRLYQAHALEYWIVDVDGRVVERWRPDDRRGELLEDALEWLPPGASSPLSLDLRDLFAEVHGEPRGRRSESR